MDDELTGMDILTEEEAEKKAQMIRASASVAEAVTQMKTDLENRGWGQSENAALMLFNTLLMTSFGESHKEASERAEKKFKEIPERILQKCLKLVVERLPSTSLAGLDVASSCFQMLINKSDEELPAAVWEDFFGPHTRGVMFSIYSKSEEDVREEFKKEAETDAH